MALRSAHEPDLTFCGSGETSAEPVQMLEAGARTDPVGGRARRRTRLAQRATGPPSGGRCALGQGYACPDSTRRLMKVFATGATGAIGHRAVPLLIQAGHRVTAVGRTPEKRAALTEAGAETVELDLFDRAAVRQAVAGHEAVVNLATRIPATMGRLLRPGAFEENDRLRRDASVILSAAASEAGVERLVQESFAGIYDAAGAAWVDEASAVRPARYARTVLDAEASAQRFSASGGAGVVLRFAAFYGPDPLQVREMARAVRWGWSPLPGRPEAYFSSVHLDDAAAAVVAALGVPAGIYTVADDEPVTRRAFVNALADALGVAPPRFAPAWAGRLMGELGEAFSRSVRLSNRRFRAESGWTPQYPSVREGWPAVVGAWTTESIEGRTVSPGP